MMKEEYGVAYPVSRKILLGLVIFCSGPLVSGCIVLEEKYNAEKTRSLNFQRLLAQEEKRTAELDNEVKRSKNELAAFEARNKELAAQVQATREQMARLQEEAEAIKESAFLERKALEDMRKSGTQSAKPKKAGPAGDVHGDSGGMRSETPKAEAPAPATKSGTTVHVVKPGETLFRIGRRYGIELEKLKKMNKLPDDIIEVGQKLIVGTE